MGGGGGGQIKQTVWTPLYSRDIEKTITNLLSNKIKYLFDSIPLDCLGWAVCYIIQVRFGSDCIWVTIRYLFDGSQ